MWESFEQIPIEIWALVVAFISMAISLIANIIRPLLKPKSKLEYSADHYFITPKLASHDYLIKNTGNAPSKDIGLFLALKPPHKITKVFHDPPPCEISGGEGSSKVTLNWKELPPKNLILVRVVGEADKEKLETVFPMEFKIWDKKGVIGTYEFRNP